MARLIQRMGVGRDVQPCSSDNDVRGKLDLALRARLPHPGLGHGHHGNLTAKDQMTSDFAFHLSDLGFEMQTVAAGLYFSGS